MRQGSLQRRLRLLKLNRCFLLLRLGMTPTGLLFGAILESGRKRGLPPKLAGAAATLRKDRRLERCAAAQALDPI
jgi:hypothetical protein